MIIGGHLSTKEGFGKLPEIAVGIGFNTYQFFSKNQMQWKSKPIDDKSAQDHIINMKKYNIIQPAIHASYLLNLGSPEESKWEQSYAAFIDEILRANKLGVELLIFHPGAHMGSGTKNALNKIVEGMNRAIEETKGLKVKLTVENTAGQGTVVGSTIEDLQYIRDGIEDKSRLGFCFDTCHAFQAGYNLNENYNEIFDDFVSSLGNGMLVAFHLNDSKPPFNKHLDRHEMLGKGNLSKQFFINLLTDSRWKETPRSEERRVG
ncbi:deoxyribonuclease IV, partial [Ruminococcus sp. 25CYCFAH16]